MTLLTNLQDEETKKESRDNSHLCQGHPSIHPGYQHALISIRVSNPGIMFWTWRSTGAQVVRVIREATDVWGVTRRGWGRGVAFPRSEIFDIIEAGG